MLRGGGDKKKFLNVENVLKYYEKLKKLVILVFYLKSDDPLRESLSKEIG